MGLAVALPHLGFNFIISITLVNTPAESLTCFCKLVKAVEADNAVSKPAIALVAVVAATCLPVRTAEAIIAPVDARAEKAEIPART
jgi:hypothetical protein